MNDLWPINSTPYDVQAAAIKAAGGRRRFAYFMEMGLGKTQVILAEFERARAKGVVDTLLVLCPKSLIPVWQNEIVKVGMAIPVIVKPKFLDNIISKNAVVIYNIESVIAEVGSVIPKIIMARNVFFVIDESITIKGFKTKRWKAIKRWGWVPRVTRILSGYPQVQSPLDYYTQLSLVGAEVPRSPYAFRNMFCVMGGWKGKEIKGVKNKEYLGKLIASVSFQAKKKNWLDLPEKIYTERSYDLNPKQRSVYTQMLEHLEAEINDNLITVEQALHRTMKLQQVGSGFMIDETGGVEFIVGPAHNPKFKVLHEILETVDDKVIIFAHYRATMQQLLHVLESPPHVKGGMTSEEINDNVKEFNEGEAKIIVCQLQSAQYGLTLLGSKAAPCSASIYFENTYNLNSRVQSEDRNHRIGQHFPVTYVDVVGTDVEQQVVKRLQDKKKLAQIISDLADRAALHTHIPTNPRANRR